MKCHRMEEVTQLYEKLFDLIETQETQTLLEKFSLHLYNQTVHFKSNIKIISEENTTS